MAGVKITELPFAGPLTNEEILVVVQDGETRQATISEIAGTGAVRKRIPETLTITVGDGFQYVVHGPTFENYGTIILDGDADLFVVNI
jgi:hypothetical protein